MESIRHQAPTEELDYNFLLSCLRNYRRPRDKISLLLESGAIIRVKKGLYIFGPNYAKAPYSLEVLANLIYGPSYISKEYALAFYGMIPERVPTLTCMTTKRSKAFHTPVGRFTYQHLSLEAYSIGTTWLRLDEKRAILIASKEKCLADLVAALKPFASLQELRRYLLESLRIDPKQLKALSPTRLKAIAHVYKNKNVALLADLRRPRG